MVRRPQVPRSPRPAEAPNRGPPVLRVLPASKGRRESHGVAGVAASDASPFSLSRATAKTREDKNARAPACLRGDAWSTLSCMRDPFLQAALDEARTGLAEGGIPIGSVLVIDGRIVARGHNRRIQRSSAILHAEMDCLENAGRLTARDYARSTLYSTLSPCDMCSGTALLYKIPRIVIGENRTFRGPEDYVRSRGVELTLLQDEACIQLMQTFVTTHPQLWNEDIGT